MSDSTKEIEFVPSGRGKARCPADPKYPHGIAIPLPDGIDMSCFVKLPYPAPECGLWSASCKECGCTVAITATGRADDPISFYMPCQKGFRHAPLDNVQVAGSPKVN